MYLAFWYDTDNHDLLPFTVVVLFLSCLTILHSRSLQRVLVHEFAGCFHCKIPFHHP